MFTLSDRVSGKRKNDPEQTGYRSKAKRDAV